MSFSPSAVSVVFMGTPEFAVPSLQALIQEGYDLRAVYSQPPRPKGRGHLLQKSPVHLLAEASGIPVKTPLRLKAEAIAELKSFSPVLIVVAAYRLILPQEVLDIPSLGCLNVHASLLPRWRGAAPLQHALLAGDPQTGITLMEMDGGMDTGPMVASESLEILPHDTTASLTQRLAVSGGHFLVEQLPSYLKGEIRGVPQPSEGVCYAPKIRAIDGRIDWSVSALVIERQVRALKAWFMVQGRRFRLDQAVVVPAPSGGSFSGQPGTLVEEQPLCILCGNSSAFRPVRLTPEGGTSMDWAAFLRGAGPSFEAGICLS